MKSRRHTDVDTVVIWRSESGVLAVLLSDLCSGSDVGSFRVNAEWNIFWTESGISSLDEDMISWLWVPADGVGPGTTLMMLVDLLGHTAAGWRETNSPPHCTQGLFICCVPAPVCRVTLSGCLENTVCVYFHMWMKVTRTSYEEQRCVGLLWRVYTNSWDKISLEFQVENIHSCIIFYYTENYETSQVNPSPREG